MIIGVSGKAGSGKSTFASVLKEEFGFEEVCFADHLKFVTGYFLLPGNNEIDHLKKMNGSNDDKNTKIPGIDKTYREVLQAVGVGMRVCIHPDIWIKLAAPKIVEALDFNDVVISDVRFNNEAEWIKNQGGKIILIERENNPHHVPKHASEEGIDPKFTDITVKNKGNGLEDFKQDIETIVQTFLFFG